MSGFLQIVDLRSFLYDLRQDDFIHSILVFNSLEFAAIKNVHKLQAESKPQLLVLDRLIRANPVLEFRLDGSVPNKFVLSLV